MFKDTPELRLLEDSEVIVLSTNREALSWVENTLQINGNTVYRQLLRLIEAGVISKKVNHGSQMNFELFINPDFLLIRDLITPDYKPTSKYLDTKNPKKEAFLNTTFTPEHLTPEKEHSNNLNISVDNVILPTVRIDDKKEQERTQKKNFEKEHREISQSFNREYSETERKSQLLIQKWIEKEPKVAPARDSKLRE